MMAEGQHTACGHCGQHATKKCGSCKNMQYCSTECQQADWQYHRTLCKSFAEFAEKPRPDVCRAILLPEDGDKPRFIWLPVEAKDGMQAGAKARIISGSPTNILDWGVPEKHDMLECRFPTKDNPLGEFEVDTKSTMIVCGKLRSGERLNHSILLMMRRDAYKYALNPCLKGLAKQYVHPELARGPLIIFGMNKVKLPKYTVDLDTTALTLALDAVIGLAPPGVTPLHAQKVMAVKVNNKTTPPRLEQFKIPKRHPAFKARNKSEVGEFFRTPLRVWYYPANSETETSYPSSIDSVNAPFDPKIVHLCLDTASPDFGRVPAPAQADKRSMLVVRPPNQIDLGIDITHFTRLGTNFQDLLAPFLTDPRGGTPEECLRKANAISAELWQKTSALMKGLGLADKDYQFPGV